jgi:putative nucleotidyltransferase with HDIG domain
VEPPGAIDSLRARLAARANWLSHAALWAWLALVSVASAFALSPGLYGQQVPALGPQEVGKPFAASSPAGFKAARDYLIVHGKLTERRREEARAAVRTVYDYRPAVRAEVLGQLHEDFDALRGALSAEGNPPSPEKAEVARKKRGEASSETLPPALAQARKELEERLGALESEDFSALWSARFSHEAESAAQLLLQRAYATPVVFSRDDLAQAGAFGISVRNLDADGAPESRLPTVSAPTVRDLREVREELDRFASVPGNLLPDSPPSLIRAVLRLAKRHVRPNLTVNIAESEARREAAARAVGPAIITIKKGEKVIGDGELITENHLVLLQGMRAQTDQLDIFQLQLGGAGLVALLIAGAYAFFRAALQSFRPTRKDALLLGLLLVLQLLSMHFWMALADAVHDRYTRIPLEALYFLFPVAAGAMLVRFILNEALALFFAVIVACLAGLMVGNSLSFALFSLVGSLVAADRITRAKDRVGIFRAGVAVGLVNCATVVCLSLAQGRGLSVDTAFTAGFALLGSGLALPVVVMAITPLIELMFGYASDIKLLELANLNHPALKELIVQAPGTYHHSIILGSLVEAAAEAIAANPLLARSCAYYHDIGKGKNPLYFGENQKSENRHDTLAPAMSAVIIKRHVTDGLEMARQYKLPKRVVDVIAQHHGTRLVGFFHHKAMKEQEGKENPVPVDESVYRYTGPKPQFREAALVMIADAVEAASRAMPEPTTSKLQALVQRIINVVFSEGQLDDCELTLKDLHLIAQSFLRTLEGIYHTRPIYPPGAVGGRPGSDPGSRPGPLNVAADGKRTTG